MESVFKGRAAVVASKENFAGVRTRKNRLCGCGMKWQRLTHSRNLTMSLNISLPAELENRVRDHVASGMYGSASEVIREALRLFETYQAVQAASFASCPGCAASGLLTDLTELKNTHLVRHFGWHDYAELLGWTGRQVHPNGRGGAGPWSFTARWRHPFAPFWRLGASALGAARSSPRTARRCARPPARRWRQKRT